MKQQNPLIFVRTGENPMIGALSSLRFFAIVLIYFHHLGYPGGLGAAAVTFFFALSGFIKRIP
jgi:peptidoglycan/LPS O-acetylase OafA/YrhL